MPTIDEHNKSLMLHLDEIEQGRSDHQDTEKHSIIYASHHRPIYRYLYQTYAGIFTKIERSTITTS